MRLFPHAIAAAALAVALSGCGATQIVGAVYFNLSATPSSLTIERGESGTVQVNIVRLSPLAANVDLTLEGAPEGITADKVTVGGMETTKDFVIKVGPAAETAEDLKLKIKAANLAYSQTTDVTLKVSEPTN
jgi:hypothetical protein